METKHLPRFTRLSKNTPGSRRQGVCSGLCPSRQRPRASEQGPPRPLPAAPSTWSVFISLPPGKGLKPSHAALKTASSLPCRAPAPGSGTVPVCLQGTHAGHAAAPAVGSGSTHACRPRSHPGPSPGPTQPASGPEGVPTGCGCSLSPRPGPPALTRGQSPGRGGGLRPRLFKVDLQNPETPALGGTGSRAGPAHAVRTGACALRAGGGGSPLGVGGAPSGGVTGARPPCRSPDQQIRSKGKNHI